MPLLPFEKGECCNSSMGANRAPRKDLSQSRNSLGHLAVFATVNHPAIRDSRRLPISAARNIPASDIGPNSLIVPNLFACPDVAPRPFLGIGRDLIQYVSNSLRVRLGERVLEIAKRGRFGLWPSAARDGRDFAANQRGRSRGGPRGIDQRGTRRRRRCLFFDFLFRCGL